MEWKTRITDLLGCKYPILLGAVEGLGDWKLAASVAETGAHGTITASVSKTPEFEYRTLSSHRRDAGSLY